MDPEQQLIATVLDTGQAKPDRTNGRWLGPWFKQGWLDIGKQPGIYRLTAEGRRHLQGLQLSVPATDPGQTAMFTPAATLEFQRPLPAGLVHCRPHDGLILLSDKQQLPVASLQALCGALSFSHQQLESPLRFIGPAPATLLTLPGTAALSALDKAASVWFCDGHANPAIIAAILARIPPNVPHFHIDDLSPAGWQRYQQLRVLCSRPIRWLAPTWLKEYQPHACPGNWPEPPSADAPELLQQLAAQGQQLFSEHWLSDPRMKASLGG